MKVLGTVMLVLAPLLGACSKSSAPPDTPAAPKDDASAGSSAPPTVASASASAPPTPPAPASVSAPPSASAAASAPPSASSTVAAVPTSHPVVDTTCTTDADCTTTSLWGSCCGACELRYANKTSSAQLEAFCRAHPPLKCPPMACSWGMAAPQCRAGKCQARK